MNAKEAFSVLSLHNAWHRGDDITMQSPKEIGNAIEQALLIISASQNLIDIKGRHHSEIAYNRLKDAVNGE